MIIIIIIILTTTLLSPTSVLLGHEIYGRTNSQATDFPEKLAYEKAKNDPPRLRRSAALTYLNRWLGIVSSSLQKAVTAAALRGEGSDLHTSLMAPIPSEADLLFL